MTISKSGGSRNRTNYLRNRDYYIRYSREHWPQYYKKHRKNILKQRQIYYRLNRTKILERDRKYNIKNRERKKIYNKEYRLKNLDRLRKQDRNYYWGNLDKIRMYRRKNTAKIALTRKRYKLRIKQAVLEHYSAKKIPVCEGCGEAGIHLLTIDHINENGAEERRRLGKKGGVEFYVWLVKNNFPAGYQVLCYNCNWLKRYKENNSIRSRYSKKVKLDILSHYSGKNKNIECALCGNDRLEVLTIDHINGGGHREQKKSGFLGTEYYRYLAREGYPTGFRVLCMNCNVSNSRHISQVTSGFGE